MKLSRVVYFFAELNRLAEGHCMYLYTTAVDEGEMFYIRFSHKGKLCTLDVPYEQILNSELPITLAKSLFNQMFKSLKEN